MDKLRQRFLEKYNYTNLDTIRDMYNKIHWDERLIGIKGQRGVGKTTLLLQYIKKNLKPDQSVIYISLDNMYFHSNSLYDFTDQFVSKGGKYLFLDEVHRYKNWGKEIKNIYDDFPKLKVVFTGSSILQLKKANADISRRAVMYELPGLSFREFINFETKANLKPISLDNIINDHTYIAVEMVNNIHPLAYWENYLSYGYYPFYLESRDTFHMRLSEAINMVLEVDIPQFEEIRITHINKLKQLLYILSESVPFKPNMQKLAERTEISINTLKSYLQYLSDAQLINLLKPEGIGISTLAKPEKIYLNNTNLLHNLATNLPEKGNLRETFFMNQVKKAGDIRASKKVDFYMNNKYSFEVGGKTKGKKQIVNVSNAFVVKDDMEVGFENQVPLWLFGFLY